MKITEKRAKEIVDDLKKSRNIEKFIADISYNCFWYGRYSPWPRINFTKALATELMISDIDIYYPPNPIYVLQTDDLDMIAKESLDRDLTKDEKEEAVRLLQKVGLPGWDETLAEIIDQAVNECKEVKK